MDTYLYIAQDGPLVRIGPGPKYVVKRGKTPVWSR
jgi:hypothetical protein